MTPVPYLQQLGACVPATRTSVGDLRERLGLTESQVRLYVKFLGLDRIAVADDLELADLLVAAGRAALGDSDPGDVRWLLHTHTLHLVAPTQPVLDQVRERLGLVNASAFAVSHLDCVAGLHAVGLAGHLLAGADSAARVLVTAGEKVVSPPLRVIPGMSIMGEAAAACLVGPGPGGDEVLAVSTRTLGQFYRGHDAPPDVRATYRQRYAELLCAVLRDAVDRAGVASADLAAILPHNVNRVSWRQVADHFGYPLDRVFLDNLPRLGHCFGADPFINLLDARVLGRVGPGDVVALASAGLAGTFCVVVLRLGDRR